MAFSEITQRAKEAMRCGADDVRGNWEINTREESPPRLTSVKVPPIIIQQGTKKQHANLKALFMDFHQIYGFIYYLQLRSVTSYKGA